MEDSQPVAVRKLSFTPTTLAAMMGRAVARERKRIVEEIEARAEVERGLGNEETALTLEEVIEGIMPTITNAGPDMSKLIVKGHESLPHTTFFATDSEDGDAAGDEMLPPMREHGDEEDVSRIVNRRFGA